MISITDQCVGMVKKGINNQYETVQNKILKDKITINDNIIATKKQKASEDFKVDSKKEINDEINNYNKK